MILDRVKEEIPGIKCAKCYSENLELLPPAMPPAIPATTPMLRMDDLNAYTRKRKLFNGNNRDIVYSVVLKCADCGQCVVIPNGSLVDSKRKANYRAQHSPDRSA